MVTTIYYVMVSSINNTKLMLLSQMTEHDWFEWTYQKWLCISLNVRQFAKLIWRKAISVR